MRFFSPSSPGKVLGINRRNLEYIFELNPRERFPLADDKLESKKLLQEAGLPVPRTPHFAPNQIHTSIYIYSPTTDI